MSQATHADIQYSSCTSAELVGYLMQIPVGDPRRPSYQNLRNKIDVEKPTLDTLQDIYAEELASDTLSLREADCLLICLLRNSARLGVPEEQRVKWVQQFGQYALKLAKLGGPHDADAISLGFAAFRKDMETSSGVDPLSSEQRKQYSHIVYDAQVDAGRILFAKRPRESLALIEGAPVIISAAVNDTMQNAIVGLVFDALSAVENFATLADFERTASQPRFIKYINTTERRDTYARALLKGVEVLNAPERRGELDDPILGAALVLEAVRQSDSDEAFDEARAAFEREADKLTFAERAALLQREDSLNLTIYGSLLKRMLTEALSPDLPDADLQYREIIALAGIENAREDRELCRASAALLAVSLGYNVTESAQAPKRPVKPEITDGIAKDIGLG